MNKLIVNLLIIIAIILSVMTGLLLMFMLMVFGEFSVNITVVIPIAVTGMFFTLIGLSYDWYRQSL